MSLAGQRKDRFAVRPLCCLCQSCCRDETSRAQSTELVLDSETGRFQLQFAVAPAWLRWHRKGAEGSLEDIECVFLKSEHFIERMLSGV